MEQFLSLPFLIVLGLFIGPSMFLGFEDFTIISKIIYCLLLLLALVLIFIGLKYRKFKKGLIMMLLGVSVWALCGLAGLGTGT